MKLKQPAPTDGRESIVPIPDVDGADAGASTSTIISTTQAGWSSVSIAK